MTSLLPRPPAANKGAFIHFAQRLHERIDPEENAIAHWWRIITAVDARNAEVCEFMGRLNRRGRVLFRYHIEHPRPVYIVFCRNDDVPVTILTSDRPLRCGSRRQRLIIDGVAYGL